MLKVYDGIILDILRLSGTEVIIATGLYQKPYETLSSIIGYKTSTTLAGLID